MIRQTGNSGIFRTRAILLLAIGCFLPASQSFADNLTPRSSDVSLEAKYVAEVLNYEIQRAEYSGMALVAEGLKYASSKLCKIEISDELEKLNLASKKSLGSMESRMNKNKSALQDAFRHILESRRLGGTSPAMAKVHRESAQAALEQLVKQRNQIDRSLAEVRKNLVKTEVVYQRVLAECLLDDFKSIFGGGGIPVPEPEGDDKWPDELWDDGDAPLSDFLDID